MFSSVVVTVCKMAIKEINSQTKNSILHLTKTDDRFLKFRFLKKRKRKSEFSEQTYMTIKTFDKREGGLQSGFSCGENTEML